jgi:hypothetical protein
VADQLQAGREIDQHFVSQFYLRNFLATDLPSGANRALWVADLDTKRIDTYSTKTVANVEHLYEQKDASSPLPRIEPLLKLIEDRAAPGHGSREAQSVVSFE